MTNDDCRAGSRSCSLRILLCGGQNYRRCFSNAAAFTNSDCHCIGGFLCNSDGTSTSSCIRSLRRGRYGRGTSLSCFSGCENSINDRLCGCVENSGDRGAGHRSSAPNNASAIAEGIRCSSIYSFDTAWAVSSIGGAMMVVGTSIAMTMAVASCQRSREDQERK